MCDEALARSGVVESCVSGLDVAPDEPVRAASVSDARSGIRSSLGGAVVVSLKSTAPDCGDVPPSLSGLSTSHTLYVARGISPFRLTLYAPDSRLTAMSPASPVKDRDNPLT
jgi:hypothetical protein